MPQSNAPVSATAQEHIRVKRGPLDRVHRTLSTADRPTPLLIIIIIIIIIKNECHSNHSPRTFDKKCHHRNNPI